MRKILLSIIVLCIFLVGCSKKDISNSSDDNKLIIGASQTPHAELLEYLKEDLEEENLDVKIVTFSDYVQPNLQLESGDIDANFFQHKPYLDKFNADRNTHIVGLEGSEIFVSPIAAYSVKIKNISELKDNAEIIIPNDPTNGARALILLDKLNIIKLKDRDDLNATEKDIVENPKHLKFIAMDAPAIPKAYKDADAAVINSNYAIGANISPTKDSILLEEKDSPYANIVVVKKENENDEKFKKLIKVLNSETCKQLIEEDYKGEIIPAF